MPNNNSAAKKLIAGILIFVALLVGILLIAQNSFSHKLRSITITTNSGPVSPEFQQTSVFELTSTSCSITVTKTISNEVTSTACNLQADKFGTIQKDIYTYSVIDKVLANKQPSQLGPLGGPSYTISITLNNGQTYTTESNANFTESIQPLLDDLNLYVDNFSDLGI
ncbi:hypothetical protein EXS53_00385 [Patescibacteria group bacterium]|nr:hypothetical protein [Patescibacteria group bacterium]